MIMASANTEKVKNHVHRNNNRHRNIWHHGYV